MPQKLLHRPLTALRESAIRTPGGGEELGAALRTLFALEQALESGLDIDDALDSSAPSNSSDSSDTPL